MNNKPVGYSTWVEFQFKNLQYPWPRRLFRAMSSASGRDEFLKQFEAIVESVKQNRSKVSGSWGRLSRGFHNRETIATVKQQSQHYRDTIAIVLDALGVVVGAVK